MADVITTLALPADLARVILVNGHDAPADRRLADGDEVAIFPPLAGGRQCEVRRVERRAER